MSAQYDEIETSILGVMDSQLDGVASIDEIFVALWRTNQQINEREFLARKIYRMTQKELLFSLQGKKGVYSTSPDHDDSEDEVGENEAGANLA